MRKEFLFEEEQLSIENKKKHIIEWEKFAERDRLCKKVIVWNI